MGTPIPNITGGAATAGDIRQGTDVVFGPVSVGGLFGSSARGSQNDLLIPALVIGGAILAFTLFSRRRRR